MAQTQGRAVKQLHWHLANYPGPPLASFNNHQWSRGSNLIGGEEPRGTLIAQNPKSAGETSALILQCAHHPIVRAELGWETPPLKMILQIEPR